MPSQTCRAWQSLSSIDLESCRGIIVETDQCNEACTITTMSDDRRSNTTAERQSPRSTRSIVSNTVNNLMNASMMHSDGQFYSPVIAVPCQIFNSKRCKHDSICSSNRAFLNLKDLPTHDMIAPRVSFYSSYLAALNGNRNVMVVVVARKTLAMEDIAVGYGVANRGQATYKCSESNQDRRRRS